MPFVIAALYHFFEFPQFESMQTYLRDEMRSRGIKGSLLITCEGMNGTMAGTREAIDGYISLLESIAGGKITVKESYCDYQPFAKGKVRLKKETISLGEPVDMSKVGRYVSPKEWNDLLNDPEVILLDSRNDYEAHLGTFEGAITPDIANFKQLPDYIRQHLADAKHKRIATFCTGGIRCEKLTAWMVQEGFEEVYHLQGGILQYFEDVPQDESKWQGECFVFDERVAVTHDLAPSPHAELCARCDHSLTADDKAHPDYQEGTRCPYCETSPKNPIATLGL